MHRLQTHKYVGKPGETVSVNLTLQGGGQASVFVDGQALVGNRFQLPATAGATVRMQVALVGPQGASCVVAIAVVDGGSDGALLLCSVFDPAPVNLFDFSVAAQAALASFASARTRGPAGTAGGTRSTAKGSKAKTKRKAGGR